LVLQAQRAPLPAQPSRSDFSSDVDVAHFAIPRLGVKLLMMRIIINQSHFSLSRVDFVFSPGLPNDPL